MRLCVCLILLLLPAFSSAAPVFCVATDGHDDTGDGSSGNPWATITHAVDSVPDGALVLVRPGRYDGRVSLRRQFAQGITVRSEVPCQAQLRHTATVVQCFYGQGITLEGFDIAHSGPGAGALVVQIQDLLDQPGAGERVERITLRGNVIHDSWNNDLLKINNGARDILVEGNVFHNQAGSDEHIDINSVTDVVVQDNIFFNDFAGSGRTDGSDTSSFIVIKDSNGDSDAITGAERITVRRNVFLHWQGSAGSNFILCGEDGQDFFEARDVLIENNLMLGDSASVMRAAFGVKGCRDITFRHNTVSGDLPSLAYAMRLNREGANRPSENIRFLNNIWCDPAGTMGAENPARPNDFSDTPPADTLSWTLRRNLAWNGPAPIPFDAAELINFSADPEGIALSPSLPTPAALTLPRWDPQTGLFGDGSATIRQAFVRLVNDWGTPGPGSVAIGAADPSESPAGDILGLPRDQAPDLGAVEVPGGALGLILD